MGGRPQLRERSKLHAPPQPLPASPPSWPTSLHSHHPSAPVLIHTPVDHRVLPEPPLLRVPREAAAGLAWHPPTVYSGYDAWRLARRAKRLFHSIAPRVRPSHGGVPALA